MSAPRSPNPKVALISLRLPENEARALDAAVSATGAASRSAFVRDCVRRVLAANKRKAEALAGPDAHMGEEETA